MPDKGTPELVQAVECGDVAELRELGASEVMLDRLRELARVPGGWLLDFEAQSVSVIP